MKIAILGKGGSGKSTLSWLLVNYLASQNKHVLAIDADHNMDLISNLGYEYNTSSPTISKASSEARNYLKIEENNHIKTVLKRDYEIVPKFSFPNKDIYTSNNSIDLTPNISIMNVGLGDENVLYSGKCAHGHISTLKFFLPLLQLDENSVVIVDSVAGVDMVNFGLYFGCDLVLIVVENHANSIKVETQISKLLSDLKIPNAVVLSKAKSDTRFYKNTLAKLEFDESILEYDYSRVSDKTLSTLEAIWKDIPLSHPRGDPQTQWINLRVFEGKKAIINTI